jgi:ubiquitin-conjugating enzyme E2 D/E
MSVVTVEFLIGHFFVMSLRRLQKELQDISSNPPANCSAHPDAQDMFHWTGTITGPRETPYESGHFCLDIHLPPDYPFRPPNILFMTRIYHPNVSSKGAVCLGILSDRWVPAMTISTVLETISSLLEHPNTEDPLLPEVAKQLETDQESFRKIAREWTQKYAA